MTSERIKAIQQQTAYPDSISVQQALLQVWNECSQPLQEGISDEQIEKWAFKYVYENKLPDTYTVFFIDSVKWYREQLKQR